MRHRARSRTLRLRRRSSTVQPRAGTQFGRPQGTCRPRHCHSSSDRSTSSNARRRPAGLAVSIQAACARRRAAATVKTGSRLLFGAMVQVSSTSVRSHAPTSCNWREFVRWIAPTTLRFVPRTLSSPVSRSSFAESLGRFSAATLAGLFLSGLEFPPKFPLPPAGQSISRFDQRLPLSAACDCGEGAGEAPRTERHRPPSGASHPVRRSSSARASSRSRGP
jgi:hypothetical protein